MATQEESSECKPNGNDSIIIPTHSTVELREPLLASDEDYQQFATYKHNTDVIVNTQISVDAFALAQ